jgi:hypothetical protein
MLVTDKSYQNHKIFEELNRYSKFYGQLAFSVFQYLSLGTGVPLNHESYVFSSMQGTLESIRTILKDGRINDAYALLRKFHDSSIINIYCSAYLKEHFSIENFVVQKINDWIKGKEAIPEFKIMSQYIQKSVPLKPVYDLLNKDDRYKSLRKRCNNHIHYNFYHHVLLNDNEIYLKQRKDWLDMMSKDLLNLVILHLGYVFFQNWQYMMSSDYIDALECDIQPEEGSQFRVAPFIQEMFDEVITPARPDLTTLLKKSSFMELS